MDTTDEVRQLLILCALRRDKQGLDWSLIAREASRDGGVEAMLGGRVWETSKVANEARSFLAAGPDADEARARVEQELLAADDIHARLVTVLDDDYPANLRLIWNLPPLLFIRGGELSDVDLRSVAVVGTRDATVEGVDKAHLMARRLVENDVTVVSGLAKGIDTAAHTATLDRSGRTIAVIGTGITRTYPAENKGLAERIVDSDGLVVSQFWPTSTPARWTFPRRNVVMSGIAQGTVVIEASSTSGAKMQARLALEHGKKVFLIKSLVTKQEWARKYVDTRGAIEVENVDDVLRHLADPGKIRDATSARQMTLTLDV